MSYNCNTVTFWFDLPVKEGFSGFSSPEIISQGNKESSSRMNTKDYY